MQMTVQLSGWRAGDAVPPRRLSAFAGESESPRPRSAAGRFQSEAARPMLMGGTCAPSIALASLTSPPAFFKTFITGAASADGGWSVSSPWSSAPSEPLRISEWIVCSCARRRRNDLRECRRWRLFRGSGGAPIQRAPQILNLTEPRLRRDHSFLDGYPAASRRRRLHAWDQPHVYEGVSNSDNRPPRSHRARRSHLRGRVTGGRRGGASA